MHHTTRELRLAAALVEAADTLSDDFGVEDCLQRLADHCVDLMAAQAAGVMLIDGGRTVSLTGSSAHEDMALDLLRAQHRGGPCLDTYGSARAVPPVSIRAARAASRRPESTERALRHDVVTTFAVALRQSDRLLGALNVFVPTLLGEPSSGSELPMAQLLADSASLGLQNNTVHSRCRTLAGQLQQALSAGSVSSRRRACSPSAGTPVPTTPSWPCGSTRAAAGCPCTGSRARSSNGVRTTPNCGGSSTAPPVDLRRTAYHLAV